MLAGSSDASRGDVGGRRDLQREIAPAAASRDHDALRVDVGELPQVIDGGKGIGERDRRLRIDIAAAIGHQGDDVAGGQEARGLGSGHRDALQRVSRKRHQARVNDHDRRKGTRARRLAKKPRAAVVIRRDRSDGLERRDILRDHGTRDRCGGSVLVARRQRGEHEPLGSAGFAQDKRGQRCAHRSRTHQQQPSCLVSHPLPLL